MDEDPWEEEPEMQGGDKLCGKDEREKSNGERVIASERSRPRNVIGNVKGVSGRGETGS